MVWLIEHIIYLGLIISAIGVAVSRNVLFSALSLAVNTTGIGFLFILKNLTFLGIIQIAIYAGGIIVLILMTIMILALGAEVKFRPTNIIFGIIIFSLIFTFVYSSLPGLNLAQFNLEISEVGKLLAGKFFNHLILAGVLLNAILVSYFLISQND